MNFNDRVNGHGGRATPAVQWPCVHDQGKLSSWRKSALVKHGEGWALPCLCTLDTPNALLDQLPKKDILVVQGDQNAKAGEDGISNWQGTCRPSCKTDSNDMGLRPWNSLATMTSCWQTHMVPIRCPDYGTGIVQMANITTKSIILVKKHFCSSVNVVWVRSFQKWIPKVTFTWWW